MKGGCNLCSCYVCFWIYFAVSAFDQVIVQIKGCKACVVQCPAGAFEITDERKTLICEESCMNCGSRISFTDGKGCLAAKSLSTTEGDNMQLKGMNRYQAFGFRRP